MKVAKLDLCRELHELSGWEAERWWCFEDPTPDSEYWIIDDAGTYPAYDLGTLLRKLPAGTLIEKESSSHYSARNEIVHISVDDDTAEDAAAFMAIRMFKNGILVREQ